MQPRLYTLGYLNRGARLHAVTTEGSLCGTAQVPRFRPAEGVRQPTCRRCLLILANGRGRLRRAMGTDHVHWGE